MRIHLLLAALAVGGLARPARAFHPSKADTLDLCVALETNDLEEFKRLLDAGGDVNSRCSEGWRPLHLAAQTLSVRKSTEAITILLERHAEVNARDDKGETPLLAALRQTGGSGNEAAIAAAKLLIDAGADVKLAGKSGDTALLSALQAPYPDQGLVQEIISHGAELTATNAIGQSILMQAANAGLLEVVTQVLTKSTSGINAREKKFGLSALMQAAVQGHADVVSELLLYGADPKLKSLAGQTARLLAQTRGHEEAAKVLAQYEGGLAAAPAPASGPAPAPAKPLRSDVDQPGYSAPEDPAAVAVVVGIENYQDLPAASYAERDAEAMRAHLRALGFAQRNIVYLSGARATKSGLIKTLETWLPHNTDEGSRVFFYYSGHGAPDPVSGEAYLVPSDGDPAYLADTAYPVKRLYEQLNALKAASVVAVLDSCFSGAGGRSVLAKGTRPLVSRVLVGGEAAGKVAALSASGAQQISGTAEDQGHGLFTYYLLRGLNGAAQDAAGQVTLKSLYEYLRPAVQDRARRDNREQTPQLFFSGDGARLRLR
jgi:ankyrin repeat protein